MDKGEKISSVARDILIEKLPSARIPVTVSLENDGEKLKFPVAIPSDKIRFDHGFFIVGLDFSGLEGFLGKNVHVQFYMSGLGYTFSAVLKKTDRFYAFMLPDEVNYLKDTETSDRGQVLAKLCYKAKNKDIVINVRTLQNYNIFASPKWTDVPEMYREKAQKLLSAFVEDSRSGMGGKIGNGLHLIRMARYLCDDFFEDSGSSKGKILPLDMIFIDDKRLVLGDRDSSYNLVLEDDYDIIAEFSVKPFLRRKIAFTCTVEDRYMGAKNSTCYSCKIRGLKEEDVRFLNESVYGKVRGEN